MKVLEPREDACPLDDLDWCLIEVHLGPSLATQQLWSALFILAILILKILTLDRSVIRSYPWQELKDIPLRLSLGKLYQ